MDEEQYIFRCLQYVAQQIANYVVSEVLLVLSDTDKMIPNFGLEAQILAAKKINQESVSLDKKQEVGILVE